VKGDVRYVVRGAVVGAVLGRPLDTSRAVKLGLGVLGLIRQLVEL